MTSPAVNGAQRARKHADRLHWLKAHRDLLLRLPSANQDVDTPQSDALDEAVRRMKFEKLYGPTFGTDKVRWGIRILVSELRGELMPFSGAGQKSKRAGA